MKTAYIRLPKMFLSLCLIVLCLVAIFSVRYFILDKQDIYTLSPALFGKSIVIDVGHGGWDPGVEGVSGVIESDINLAIATKLAEYCRNAGALVTITRESDIALGDTKKNDMNSRVEITKKADADIFISIHCNSYPGQFGAQTFYENGNEQAKSLAQSIQTQIIEQLDNTDRQVLPHPNAYLLKNIDGAAVICEVGFLSHQEEAALLNDITYQWDMAWAIFTGINDYQSTNK